MEKRPYLLLSLAAALAYFYLQASAIPEFYIWPIKGSACAFLAIYAWQRHSSADARLLAGAMAVAALADMAVEFDLRVGGAIFAFFHLMLIRLFMRNDGNRAREERVDFVLVGLLVVPPVIAYLLTSGDVMKWLAAIYTGFAAIMAASAWASRFPRWKVAAGGILFVLSDLIIFAGLGPLADNVFPGTEIPLTDILVWPLYYLAQFLITVGVITSLRKRDPELRVVQGGKT